MGTPQSGIFALGTASHAYLEFDVIDKGAADELVIAVASLRELAGRGAAAPQDPQHHESLEPDDEVVDFELEEAAVMPRTPAPAQNASTCGAGSAWAGRDSIISAASSAPSAAVAART